MPSVEVSGTVVVVCGRQAFGSDIFWDCCPESRLNWTGEERIFICCRGKFPSRRSITDGQLTTFGETEDDGERKESETAQR